MCVVTVYCTAKIYSSLVTIRQWHHPLVETAYLLWALATGSVLLALLASIFGLNAPGLGRLGYVRQWESPHTAENFVMREMGYRVARRHAAKLRRYVLAAAFLAAALVLASGITSGPPAVVFAVLATLVAAFAVLVERWLFFAEAQHVSTLYYGASAA